MQVPKQQLEARGKLALPLAQYLWQGEHGDTPSTDQSDLLLGGQTFYNLLGDDVKYPAVVTFLLGGINVNTRDKSGATALHVAVRRVVASSTHGRASDYVESEMDSLIVECPNQAIIELLLDSGAEMEARNSAGETPLIVAAASNNFSAVRLLLMRGADAAQRDDMGHTPLHHAARSPILLPLFQAYVDDLKTRVAQESLLHTVCRQGGEGSVFAVLFLVEHLGADVNSCEGTLTVETETGNKALCPTRVQVVSGQTPLHCAVLTGDVTLVCALLMSGAQVDAVDSEGVTPLQSVCSAAPTPQGGSLFLRCARCVPLKRIMALLMGDKRQEVRRLLEKYSKEPSKAARDALLGGVVSSRGKSLLQYSALADVAGFVAAAFLPHIVVVFTAMLARSTFVTVIVTILTLLCLNTYTAKEWGKLKTRSLVPLGFLLGYLVVVVFCFVSQSSATVDHAPTFFNRCWLCIFAVGSVSAAALVMLGDPMTVESTVQDRLSIYKTVFHSMGALPPEAQANIDTVCMVKKPLRSQRCPYIGRVVLCYDHYCLWLANSIGAGNHRAYVVCLFCFACLLGGVWNTTRERARQSALVTVWWQNVSTVYLTLALPIVEFFVVLTLLQQLWYIGRGVTMHDVRHPKQCPWCFELGSRTYSLFDAGFIENMRRFFFERDFFTQRLHLMPAMSPRLQEIAKNYQLLNLTSCDRSHCSHQTHPGHVTKKWAGQEEQVPVSSCAASDQLGSVAKASASVAASSPALGMEPASMQLFQLMVQHNTADVDLPAELQRDFSSAEWEEVISRARSMFSFFNEAKSGGALSRTHV
ncbi:putative huntingtin interacting protein [Trypanosoma vivax]|nr:putative huntingtin interacting protein [Trypanosoma vivax]